MTLGTSPIIRRFPLGMPWTTFDPFLFCVHHNDAYPAGTADLTPVASLQGRQIGNDFSGRDGWSMYHGDTVPGFPQHPHRGFETVTFVRRGYIDHSDSLGAAARYGAGDVQWLTAGAGIVHSEMFPLLRKDTENPTELFQIWLNLPREDKMAEPYFAMLWAEDIPSFTQLDDAGRAISVTVVAGAIGEHVPPSPPPSSWATRPNSDVAIWRIALDAGATWRLPVTGDGVVRTLYVFDAESRVTIAGATGTDEVTGGEGVVVDPSVPLTITAGETPVSVLVLQGRPIGEPVAQYGPFVMNDRAGIEQAFSDYQRTQFGGWPWPADDPTHGNAMARFARRPDGRLEVPPGTAEAAVG